MATTYAPAPILSQTVKKFKLAAGLHIERQLTVENGKVVQKRLDPNKPLDPADPCNVVERVFQINEMFESLLDLERYNTPGVPPKFIPLKENHPIGTGPEEIPPENTIPRDVIEILIKEGKLLPSYEQLRESKEAALEAQRLKDKEMYEARIRELQEQLDKAKSTVSDLAKTPPSAEQKKR